MRRSTILVLLLMLIAAVVQADDHKMSQVKSTPEWEKLKTLVGSWEGTSPDEGGKPTKATTRYRMTGDGSALMNVMAEGTQWEMVTMFHPDKDDVMATHYCAGHNQPRLKLVPSKDPNKLEFQFVDGTNIREGESYMRSVTLVFDGNDHHFEDWTSEEGGKKMTTRFDFRRVK